MFPAYTSTSALTLEAGLKSGVETLRDGKGAIYIKSAGNDHTDSNNWAFDSTSVCGSNTGVNEMGYLSCAYSVADE